MMDVAASIVLASIAGSLHCTSMCGGLVAFSTGGPRTPWGSRIGAIAAYNGARGTGYVLLGTVAGSLGSTLDRVGVRIGVGRLAGAVAGLVMISWGVTKLLEALGVSLPKPRAGAQWDVPARNLVRRLREKPPALRSAIVGACTSALPCGFLHVFLVAAAGTGSALRGALVMAAFWLGTLPAVVGLGAGVDLVTLAFRRHAAILASIMLMAVGLSSLSGRFSPASLLELPKLMNQSGAPTHAR